MAFSVPSLVVGRSSVGPIFPMAATSVSPRLSVPLAATHDQELRRRFAASGSSATAFSVNPGAVRSDIWRHIPKFVMPVLDFLMRMFFITTEQVKGARTGVRTEYAFGEDVYVVEVGVCTKCVRCAEFLTFEFRRNQGRLGCRCFYWSTLTKYSSIHLPGSAFLGGCAQDEENVHTPCCSAHVQIA